MSILAFEPMRSYTLDEYFELEKSTNEKFEYWDGNVWSMSGSQFPHNQICRNLNTEFDVRLRDKGSQVLGSDMRIKVPTYSPYRYPDLTALCGKPEIEKIAGIDMLVNPQLILWSCRTPPPALTAVINSHITSRSRRFPSIC